MIHSINKTLTFLLCILLFATKINAQETTSNPSWSYIIPSVLSSSDKWLIVDKYNKVNNKNSTYFINTKTTNTQTIPTLEQFHNSLLNNNLIVGKQRGDLVIIDLENPNSKTKIDNVKTFKTVNDKNILIVHTNNNQLKIILVDDKNINHKVINSVQNVTNYLINKEGTFLIYQDKETKSFINSIDLSNFTIKEHTILQENLNSSKLFWTINQKGFIYIEKSNNILFVDLKNNSVKKISTPDINTKLERLQVQFNTNNDFYLSYNIKSDITYPETEYVDIWNANSHLIAPSNFKTKHKIIYRALFYNNTSNKLEVLERKRDKEYHLLNIPGYMLEFNPLVLEDFLDAKPLIEYKLIRINDKEEILNLNKSYSLNVYSSLDNKYLLYPSKKANQWCIYTFDTQEVITIETDNSLNFKPTWTIDSKEMYYKKDNNIYLYNLMTKKTKRLTDFSNTNTINLINTVDYFQYKQDFINPKKPILFTVNNNSNKSIFSIKNNSVKEIIKDNNNQIISDYKLKKLTSSDGKTLIYTEQNHNLPERIMMHSNGKSKILFENDIPLELYQWRKQKHITYTDIDNKVLKGVLSYPKNYDKNKKYPMVAYIYGKIDGNPAIDPKAFNIPSYVNGAGFNSALLNEKGYFVYFTDTYGSDKGPGINALINIEQSISEVLKAEPSIDSKNLGLIGHSFGGYKASYIATQSDLFAAIVSGAGIHDVISGHTYIYSNYRKRPNYYMAEKSQFQLQKTFEQDPEKYLSQSPLLHAQTMNTPILLWTGLNDENVNWTNTQKMFLALKRFKKPTIALFYNNVDHAMGERESKQAKDLTQRTLDWFDYFLKDKKDIKWIQEGIDYNKYSWSKLDDI